MKDFNMIVNNTDINFKDIGTSLVEIKDCYKNTKGVPADLKDIIKISEWEDRLIIDWV